MEKSESAIWNACRARAAISPLQGSLLRLVESQEQVATRHLVSSLERQAVLEELLERSKPPRAQDTAPLHYLLATPFRYPPLRHGSRFGRRHEPSLFYGALSVDTVLAEGAYYRFLFWDGMATPPHGVLTTQHTLFQAAYAGERGVRLHQPPFDAWRGDLTHPADYGATQALGSRLRAATVDAFEYTSARDPQAGLNVALFTPSALACRRPALLQPWLAETGARRVVYYCPEQATVRGFDRELFLVDGVLPAPAP